MSTEKNRIRIKICNGYLIKQRMFCLNMQKLTKATVIFIFMSRTPELYFALLGVLKIGAIVRPLFEAFMEKAVADRLVTVKLKC